MKRVYMVAVFASEAGVSVKRRDKGQLLLTNAKIVERIIYTLRKTPRGHQWLHISAECTERKRWLDVIAHHTLRGIGVWFELLRGVCIRIQPKRAEYRAKKKTELFHSLLRISFCPVWVSRYCHQ